MTLMAPIASWMILCERWRLWMRLEAVEDIRDFLTLVGSKSGYVDQGLHALWTSESYDRTGIGVPCQHNPPFSPLEAAVESCRIVGKRCQRQRHRCHLQTLCLECRNDSRPT